MVTHHVASLTATAACRGSRLRARASRPVASDIAVSDQSSAAPDTSECRAFALFHASRHSAEQNRECSRRGTNSLPHSSHRRTSDIRPWYAVIPGSSSLVTR